MRRLSIQTTLAALAMAITTTFAQADVTKFLPADAAVVVKVSNLKQTSDKLSKFTSKLGVNMFVPELGNPLESLKERVGIKGGLNDAGEFAFVVRTPDEGQKPQEVIFMLIPVSDYAAFTAGLEGAQTQGDITEFNINGEKSFVANWGKYAAVSPTKDIIAAAPTEVLKIDGKAAANMKAADLSIFSNLQQVMPLIGKELARNKDEFMGGLTQQIKESPNYKPEFDPMVDALGTQLFNAIEAFTRDSKASTLSLSFVDAGVTTSVVTEFKDGSYLKSAFSGIKNTDAPLSAGLPAGNYVAFGGLLNSPEAIQKLVDDVFGPVLAAAPKQEKYKIFADAQRLMEDVIGATDRVTFGMVTPSGQIGKDSLVQILAFSQGKADVLARTTAESLKLQQEFQSAFGVTEGMATKTDVVEGAKTIAGVSFDELATTFTVDEKDPFAAQQRQAIEMMYGPGPVKQYVGVAGDKSIVFSGVSDDLAAALVESAKANSPAIAALPQVKTTASHLPATRFAEYYIGLDQIVTAGANAAGQLGMPIQFPPLPNDLEPIGVSISSDQGDLEVHGFVSTRLLQTLISAGFQVMGQMQGGGGGGPGGL